MAGVGLLRTLRPGCSSPIKPGGRVILVGDSLGVGMAPYFQKMATEAGMDFVSRVAGGTQTFQWAGNPEIQSLAATFRPTLAIISLGTNDAKGTRAPELLRGDVLKLQRALGTEIFWILPPKLPFQDRGYAQIVRDTGVRVFESAKYPLPQGPDGIHLSGRGYAYWAALVWKDLMCDTGDMPVPPVGGVGAVGRR